MPEGLNAAVPTLVEYFDGTGSAGQTVTLRITPVSVDQVTVPGFRYLKPGSGAGTYSLSGKVLTLNDAVTAGTGNIEVHYQYDPSIASLVHNVPSTLDSVLSFDQSLSGTQSKVTSWSPVDTIQWLDFIVELGAAQACTALIEYTSAADPNTTPPGSGDVTRPISTAIAGASLGGITKPSFGVVTQGLWARVTVTNLVGSGTVKVRAYRFEYTPNTSQVPLATTLTKDFRAAITKSLATAQQPDGDFVNERADGEAFSTSTPLGISGTYTSAWTDTDGWETIDIFIAADQTGAVAIQFTRDAQAGSPSMDGSVTMDFTAADVSNGYRTIRIPTVLDGFRVIYTNGGTAQGSFLLVATLRVTPVGPQDAVRAIVTDQTIAQYTQTVLKAKNPSGVYAAIERGGRGLGLDVDMVALDSWDTNQVNVGSGSAVQLVGSALTGQRAVGVTGLPTGNNTIWWGPTSGVTTGNGDLLPANAEKTMDLNSAAIWLIATGNNQTVSYRRIGR